MLKQNAEMLHTFNNTFNLIYVLGYFSEDKFDFLTLAKNKRRHIFMKDTQLQNMVLSRIGSVVFRYSRDRFLQLSPVRLAKNVITLKGNLALILECWHGTASTPANCDNTKGPVCLLLTFPPHGNPCLEFIYSFICEFVHTVSYFLLACSALVCRFHLINCAFLCDILMYQPATSHIYRLI